MRHRTLTAAAGAALIGLAVLGWVLLDHGASMPGEHAVIAFEDRRHGTTVTQLSTFLGDLGTDPVALVTILLAVGVVARALGSRAALAVLLVALAPLLNDVLKHVLGPTPIGRTAFGDEYPSYPSGHVAYATAFFGGLALLARRHGRADAAAILAGLVVAMGPARIVSHAHLLSDVVAGYAVGAGWLLLVLAALGAPLSRRSGSARARRGP